jgi:hypothetical protein
MWIGGLVGCAGLDGVLVTTEVEALPLGTTYTQSVYTPPGADTGPGAPWVLLLDGDVWTEEAASQLDRAVRRGDADPLVLVGLGHQATRTRDYTPFPSDGVAEASAGSVGEIVPFFDWVLDEWLPALEADTGWGGDRRARTLTGHSYGGLATAWVMSHHTDAFGCYGAVSPSLWWDDGAALGWTYPLDGASAAVVYGAVEDSSLVGLAHAWAASLASQGDGEITERRLEGGDHITVPLRQGWGVVFEACR